LRRAAISFAFALAAGCGTTGDYAGGAANLPDWGGGTFAPIAADPAQSWNAPFVLQQASADLADPDPIASGAAISIWVAVARPGGFAIARADAETLDGGFGALAPALSADAAWEQGAVRGPSVVPGAPWLMLYAAGGAIGAATSPDGAAWSKPPAPALTADGGDEGASLGAPAAIVVGEKLRVYYAAAGAIWAAEAPLADFQAARAPAWTRLDGDPSTPARDPIVRGVPFGGALDRPFARAEPTVTGAIRYTLGFSVALPDGTSGSGFAASFDGISFAVQQTPLLPLAPASAAPALVRYGDRPLVFYVGRFGARDAIAVAARP